jgi:group I intron endonuclease
MFNVLVFFYLIIKVIIMNGIIYNIKNKINNKIYIGQTTRSFETRINEHINYPSNCSIVDRAIQKYGENNFEWKILEEDIDNQRDLNLLEKFWIIHLETRTTQNGYNITSGGYNCKHSKETKQKMSKAHMGDKNHFYGKHHSEETKEKMSNAVKGKTHSKETKQKMSKTKIGKIGKKSSFDTRKKLSYTRENKYIGASFIKNINPEKRCFLSKINFNGNRIYLGIYEDPLSASIVYKLVRNELYKEDLKYVKKE